jgi:hypothetical protein
VSRHHSIRAQRGGSRGHREGLKGDYDAEFENWDNSVAVQGEDDKEMGGESRGRMGGEKLEVCEESPRSAGRNASASWF